MGIMSLCYTESSLKFIRRFFGKYGVSNVTEAFLFDVSIYTVHVVKLQNVKVLFILIVNLINLKNNIKK